MLRKKTFYICFLMVCSLLLNSCSSKDELNDPKETKYIDFIVKNQGRDYWAAMRVGAEAAAREFNVSLNFTAPYDEMSIEGQIELVNEGVVRATDAIVIAAIDYNKLVEVTEKAYDSKIPVIITDSQVNTKKINSYIATDNYLAGRKAGEKLLELTGGGSNIAIINFIKGAKNAEQREEGVLKAISDSDGSKVVAKEYSSSNEQLAYETTKKLIKNHKELNGIAALNDTTAEGVAQAIEELGLSGKIKLVAFDSSSEEIEYIERGIIQATVIQKPFNMGYLSVKYAAMAARGQKIPENIDTGSILIDKQSMYLPENQKFVFPFIR
jgi:ribose transport system substrate-binding protein